MQARGGLVQDVDGAARGPLAQFLAELHPLGLAAGQRGGALAQADVPQPHVHEGLQLVGQHGDGRKEPQRLLHGHVEHVGDAVPLVVDLEGLAVVALALALLAGDVDVREEVHLDLEDAVALALLAAPSLHVEAVAARRIAPRLALGQLGEQLAQGREEPRVGGGIAAGRAADGGLVDVDDLVHGLEALDGPVFPYDVDPLVQLVGEGLVEDLVHQGALAGSADAGHTGEEADGKVRIHFLEVVLLGTQDGQLPALGLAACPGHGNGVPARQEIPGDGTGRAADLVRCALGHHPAAVLAGAGAHVHHVVRGQDGLQVVLHHQHRVAQVAHLLEGADELQVVPLVQADARLVQHVEHALELAADLGGETNALALAAGQGGRAAVQGEVAEAHVIEKPQPLADLLQHFLGDDRVLAFQGEIGEPAAGLAHALGRHVGNVQVAHEHGQDLGLEAPAPAVLAGDDPHGFLQLRLDLLAGGLAVAAIEVADDALEMVDEVVAVPLAFVGEPHLLLGAVEEQAADVGGQLLPGRVEAELQLAGQLVQQLGAPAVLAHALPPAGLDGALVDGEGRVRDDQLLGKLALEPEAVAGGTGAVGAVEGEGAGLQLRQAQAELRARRVVAGQLGGKELLRAILAPRLRAAPWAILRTEALRSCFGLQKDEGAALGQVAGDLQAVRQSGRDRGAHLQAVDHHLQGVLLLLVQVRDALREVEHLAIDPGPDVAALHEVLEQPLVLALPAAHHRRQDLQPSALGSGEDLVGHFLDGLAGDGPTAGHTGGLPRPGVQQPQVIVDLGHRGHRGTGVLAGGLLLDGDGRGEPLDAVHVRLFHLIEELAGVGREALHVAPLALRVERVEGQAGLA